MVLQIISEVTDFATHLVFKFKQYKMLTLSTSCITRKLDYDKIGQFAANSNTSKGSSLLIFVTFEEYYDEDTCIFSEKVFCF